MGRQESPQLIERKTQADTDAQEISRASKYFLENVALKSLPLRLRLPTLHCTVIGLGRERFVALGLPS